MSVSLDEVLTAAGYDIRNNVEDAQWLLSQKDEFEELLEIAERTSDDYDDYKNYVDEYEDEHDDEPKDFETWRDEK